ncbi:hypothetical protein [Paenibacillus sp. OK003]|uniref:hypothetical protein n=1 Tax=Paenibacillus sp. OK003 TaxID=1884380 RepID=UPI0008B74F66|nr:hypothetical protein [Paenibacillus sp. OK003]SEL78490.1 hypothetical protein SAMN05518856_11864 [Paenibacillus sp. OK003]
MFNYDKKFVSLGVEYNENNFRSVVNRKTYEDMIFPPTKPIEGGLWGSEINQDEKFISSWQEYIYEKLNKSLFKHKLKNKSTFFSIKHDSRVLSLDSLKDIVINLEDENLSSNISLRLLEISGDVPKQYENHLYIDFERLVDYYDAIHVSMTFVKNVDWILKEYTHRVENNLYEWDEDITPESLFKAELFEDWNVDSILILNNECINILKIDKL